MGSTRIFFTVSVLFLLITQPIMPHGLGADTLIWTQPTLIWIKSDLYNSASYGGQAGDWKTIQAVCEELVHEHIDLLTPSYDITRGFPGSAIIDALAAHELQPVRRSFMRSLKRADECYYVSFLWKQT